MITQKQVDKLVSESSNFCGDCSAKLRYQIKKALFSIKANNVNNITVKSYSTLKRNLTILINNYR